MKYRNIYWDEYLMSEDNKAASILAIGDSWFWYPFPGGSLLNALAPVLEDRQHTVLAVGRNGAEAFDYVHGVYQKLVDRALRFHGGASLTAVFVSGGGNDFAGYNDLRPLLGADCTGAPDENACFVDAHGNDMIGPFMADVHDNLDALVGKILAKVGDRTQILLHTYAYAIPTGVGVGNEGWLLPALKAAKVPPALREKCVRLLLDRYKDELDGLAAAHARVHVVDTRDALASGDWANELHPKPKGFRKIAQRWKPTLAACGI